MMTHDQPEEYNLQLPGLDGICQRKVLFRHVINEVCFP